MTKSISKRWCIPSSSHEVVTGSVSPHLNLGRPGALLAKTQVERIGKVPNRELWIQQATKNGGGSSLWYFSISNFYVVNHGTLLGLHGKHASNHHALKAKSSADGNRLWDPAPGSLKTRMFSQHIFTTDWFSRENLNRKPVKSSP